MKHPAPAQPELSRPLRVDKIPAGGMAEHIVPRPAERQALAARFDLIDLPKLEAQLSVDRSRGHMFEVTGTITAEVVQRCSITLDLMTTAIKDKISVLFAPPHMLDLGAGSPHFDSGEDEAPEPIVNGVIDLGELVAQHLAVAINPYPRKAGLTPANTEIPAPVVKKATHRPFEGLSALGAKTDPEG